LQAVGNAGGNGQHVLHRAAHLHAHGVVAGVHAQGVAVEGLHGLALQGLAGAGGHQGGGPALRHLLREAGAAEHAAGLARPHGGRDLMAQRAALLLEALAQPQRGHAGRQRRQALAQGRHGRAQHHQAGLPFGGLHVGQRGRMVGRDGQRRRQGHAGQVALVAALALQRGHLGRVAGPQQDVVSPGGGHGQRGAPGAGAQHTDAHGFQAERALSWRR
jgi:hypothetical protein